ncbi:hypothetical protein L195_g058767, partial [Trifolium pratense]
MEHIPIHLPNEAILGGPVQYRWMYPFESKCGRPSGKSEVYWLLDEEWKSAHVHVLINCDEVKPYL